MTSTTRDVLSVMLAVFDEKPDEWMYGLQIAERSDDLLPGSTYPVLQRLSSLNWIEAKWEDDYDPSASRRPRRRLHRLTQGGAQAAREALEASGQQRGNRQSSAPVRPSTA